MWIIILITIYKYLPKRWYCEYDNIRIHDYISIMINQFPVLVIRRYDDPHTGESYTTCVGILGYTYTYIHN